MTQHLIRQSIYLVLGLGFLSSLLLGAEFDLVAVTSSDNSRPHRLELDELLILSTIFSVMLSGVALFNNWLARREWRRRDALDRVANLDGLTGIANRRRFFERLELALGRSRPGWGCAVILLDLDGFKAVNDGHGHAAGDRVLIHVAREIGAVQGRNCLAARLGGDEFALVIEGAGLGAAQVDDLVRKLRNRICQPIDHQGRTLLVGASIGVAFASATTASAAALLEAADGEMYRVKRRNRDRMAA
jgi:diguanylate cyclase (GGDEF)-like protein